MVWILVIITVPNMGARLHYLLQAPLAKYIIPGESIERQKLASGTPE
jgi:hypothetical protein